MIKFKFKFERRIIKIRNSIKNILTFRQNSTFFFISQNDSRAFASINANKKRKRLNEKNEINKKNNIMKRKQSSIEIKMSNKNRKLLFN